MNAIKTTNPLIFLLVSATLFFNFSFGQEIFTVTLNIDLDRLNRGNPSKSCSFTSDAVIINDASPENFTILVNEEDEVTWEAISTTGEAIDIDHIEFTSHNGKGPFGKKKLNGNGNRGNKKKVKSKVKRNTRGNEYKYNVGFIVASELYIIDPKIKIGR